MTPTGPRPKYSASEAVARARLLIGRGVYWLGTGDSDSPDDGASDCFGFAYCKAFGVKRHRAGFNRGPWATVSDDLNCDSALEDADHDRELFERIDRPELGALLVYPTIHLIGRGPWRGHIAIVVGVRRCLEWDPQHPSYTLVDVVQCHGPNGRRPGIIATDGTIWDNHDHIWPKPEHRTVILRARP